MNKKGIVALVFLSILIFTLSVFIGPRLIVPFKLDETAKEIIISIRLPRIIVSILVGAALGSTGAILQGILRNPLADPYILGLSSGAALTAALGLLFNNMFLGIFTLPAFAFLGAIAAGIAVGTLGQKKGNLLPERLLLAGVGLGFLFSAVLMLAMILSTDEGLRRATLWLFGDLSMADWPLIPYGLAFILLGFGLSLWRAKGLNALMLGDEVAYSLGFSPSKERWILFIASGLMTAASVSLGGVVGFIGLLIPHIIRSFVGSDNRVLIPMSALAGGALLCAADTIGRTVAAPMELPSGIITAIIGAPYFLYLLKKKDLLGAS
ncbi:MAG: iron ABC transporter permease [Nitrospiraceae bacterium]|nr:iron ABC transporter permease [Nitrospiraceae bacterium]